MKHYICTGSCHGHSNKPGACQAKDCEDHGKDLKQCDCKNQSHHSALKKQKKK